MRRYCVLSILLLVLILQGCQETPQSLELPPPQPPPIAVRTPSTPQPSPSIETLDRDLEAELAKISEEVDGGVGIGVRNIETGESAYLNRHERYPMLSVHKLPIAMAVLKMVDDGRLRLYQDVGISPDDFVPPGYNSPLRYQYPEGVVLPLRDVIKASLAESDGTASDVLLRLAGGPAAVQDYISKIGLGDAMLIVASEKSMSTAFEMQYANWATPDATIRLLSLIQQRHAGLSEESTSYLIEIMAGAKTGERRILGGLPDDTPYSHKTGTGGRENGITSATNDVGLITLPNGQHVAIAVYIRDSKSPTAIRLQTMRNIATAVWAKWVDKGHSQSEPPAEKRY